MTLTPIVEQKNGFPLPLDGSPLIPSMRHPLVNGLREQTSTQDLPHLELGLRIPSEGRPGNGLEGLVRAGMIRAHGHTKGVQA